MLKNFSKEILLQQVKAYSNLYKPTNIYPHAQFWGAVNESIFKWLYEQKRLTRPLPRSPRPGSPARCRPRAGG